MSGLQITDLPHYTYADYVLWDGKWELIAGIPYAMSPTPTIQHQDISYNIAIQLAYILKNCDKCRALLPIDWKIDEETVVQPDNLVICHTPDNDNYLTQAPEIIFEILSPSTAKKDQTTKFELYEKEAVKYYIIVNGDEKVAKVYQWQQGKYIKIADANRETVSLDISHCGKVAFNFAQLWT